MKIREAAAEMSRADGHNEANDGSSQLCKRAWKRCEN